MDVVNDKTCFWINDLPKNISANKVINFQECEWLIIYCLKEMKLSLS